MLKRYLPSSILFSLLLLLATYTPTLAQTKDELQAQINDRNAKIAALEAEIAQTQKDLDATSKDKQTLQSAIKTLDLTRQKVTANITLTQTKMAQKDAEIVALAGNITTTTGKIDAQHEAIVSTLRDLDEEGNDNNIAISLFSGEKFSSFFGNAAALIEIRSALKEHVEELSTLKSSLITTKTATEQKRAELAKLKTQLATQKGELDANRQAKADLLALTKNKESAYQTILAQKTALKKQFEIDLADFESKLHLIIDPSSIPHTGSGVLSWPVAKPVITQTFGHTDFSTANPQVYSGHGHNGIDLKASPGTPLLAALSGTVKGTGDTDLTCPNASYGRWVLIEHANGLSTLYAHLSTIGVTKGQQVSTGEVIGYSGSTGYATGPHLHFTVYATQGVEIRTFASKSCKGKNYTMPVADLKAYLNPLSYL